MHNSITCTIQAYIREQGYSISFQLRRLNIVYVVILYLLYFQYMLGYTVHLIEVYSKLPIIVRLHMHVTSVKLHTIYTWLQ